jgi:hypothetical protein
VVSATVVNGVDVHATVISPVVGQGEDQLQTGVLSGSNNHLEDAEVNVDGAIRVECLNDGLLGSAAVLGEPASDGGCVLVMEGPCTDNSETSVESGESASLNIGIMVITPLS